MPATADEKTLIQALDIRLAKMETLMKVIVGIVAFAAVSVVGLCYQAGRVVASVDSMKESIAELKADFKARDARTTESLDRIEKSLAHNPPAGPKPTP
jgi:hypothetical protein